MLKQEIKPARVLESPGFIRGENVKIHDLKTDPSVFQAVLDGAKTYELRKNDRGYSTGDELRLRETRYTGAEMAAGDPLEYTGREVSRSVSHMLTGPIYGLEAGWSILSLASTPEFRGDARLYRPASSDCKKRR